MKFLLILIRKYFELSAKTIGEAPEWDPDYDYQDNDMRLKYWQDGLRLGVKGQSIDENVKILDSTPSYCN